MRAFILGTLFCPLFVGAIILSVGVDQSLAGGSLEVWNYPWVLFWGATALASISLFFLSRRRPSELAFGWLFFFGLLCVGLSLAETLSECARTDPYPYVHSDGGGFGSFSRALMTFLPIVITLGVVWPTSWPR